MSGVPPEASSCKRSRHFNLDWLLARYEGGTPKDSTIRERFHTERFANRKQEAADRLRRVARSVETVAITNALKLIRRS